MSLFDEGVAADGIGRLLSAMSGTMSAAPTTTGEMTATQTATSTGQTSGVVPTGTGIAQPFGGEHGGIDFSVPVGTSILAMTNGTVTHAADDDPGGYGSWVEVTSPDGIVTRYGHLSGVSVKAGDTVNAGQSIGASGGQAGAQGAGNSTGPHLHFEVRQGGVAVDPTPFLAGGHPISATTPTAAVVTTPEAAAAQGTARLTSALSGDQMPQPEQQTAEETTNPGGVEAFLAATRQHESGGNYKIFNQSGQSNASGAYQFLGSTWRGLGGSTANAADASPEEQDRIARAYALQLFEQFHDWRLVAIAWYGGPGIAQQVAAGQNPGSPEGQGPYLAYGDTIARMMAGQNG